MAQSKYHLVRAVLDKQGYIAKRSPVGYPGTYHGEGPVYYYWTSGTEDPLVRSVGAGSRAEAVKKIRQDGPAHMRYANFYGVVPLVAEPPPPSPTPAPAKVRWTLPTVPCPDERTLERMTLGMVDAEAIDGCGPVEPDGHCEHGCPAWPLHKGMI